MLALACTNLYDTESGLCEEYVAVQVAQELLPLIVVMPIGPLLYLYVRSVLDEDFKLRRKHGWHFVSGIIDLLPKVLVWICLIGLLAGWLEPEAANHWGDFIDHYNTYMDVPRWFSITLYVLLTRRLLNRPASAQAGFSPGSERVAIQRQWIRQFLNAFLLFQAIWLVFLIPYINPATRGSLLDSMSYYPIYIPLAVLVYWLGFKGYLRTQLDMAAPIPRADATIPDTPQHSAAAVSFSAEQVSEYVALLKKSMEHDKLYLEPTLTLQEVSSHTGIPRKTISCVVNQHLHKSFNEFVNAYRIEEVKKRLLVPGQEHLTIAGIALECGFNSQATFQRAFKNSTGVSPKEFISQHTPQSV
ncbi:MAG: helix-turn-helix transcriptional regulator [Cytophagales bacterium]|nr:helix-turn-helix transcriptional regulator [Cytophagales bacterium]